MSGSSRDVCISVHPLTNDPTTLWNTIKKSQKVLKIQPPLPKGPVGNNKVCIYYICFSICTKYNYFSSG